MADWDDSHMFDDEEAMLAEEEEIFRESQQQATQQATQQPSSLAAYGLDESDLIAMELEKPAEAAQPPKENPQPATTPSAAPPPHPAAQAQTQSQTQSQTQPGAGAALSVRPRRTAADVAADMQAQDRRTHTQEVAGFLQEIDAAGDVAGVHERVLAQDLSEYERAFTWRSTPFHRGNQTTITAPGGRVLHFKGVDREEQAREARLKHIQERQREQDAMMRTTPEFMRMLDAVERRQLEDQTRREQVAPDDVRATEAPDEVVLDRVHLAAPVRGATEELWVDKYGPKKFPDLLSDERINREVMKWVKTFDPVVFGTPAQVKVALPLPTEDAAAPVPTGNGYRKEAGGKPSFNWAEERAKRKEQLEEKMKRCKILLLSGPPGLGKTTLAHVVAAAAGYRVVEINASDDRSGDVLKQKVLDSTQMNSLVGDRRPNAIILDEIDGADGQGAIKALLSIIEAGDARTSAPRDDPDAAKHKKKQLNRPIICICNDQYAPSLRKLREVALIYEFRKTAESKRRLNTRLKHVARHENLNVDTNALNELCDVVDSDIRSCLNHLQFISKNAGTNNLSMLLNRSIIGKKDISLGLFDVVGKVFKAAPRVRHESVHNHLRDGMSDAAMNQLLELSTLDETEDYWSQLYSSFIGFGDQAKLVEAAYENFLSMRYQDSSFKKALYVYDWLEVFDRFQTIINTTQDYQLARYTPYTLVAFHFKCSTPESKQFQFPKLVSSIHFDRQKKSNLVRTFQQNLAANLQPFVTPSVFVNDMISPLLTILQPPVRPVNVQLLNSRERDDLESLISSMGSYHLTYTLDRSDGMSAYRLDPQLELAIPGQRTQQTTPLAPSVRQYIAREVNHWHMRRREAARSQNDAAAPAPSPAAKWSRHTPVKGKGGMARTPLSGRKGLTTPSPSQRSDGDPSPLSQTQKPRVRHFNDLVASSGENANKKVKTEKVARDFFGRPIEVKEKAAADMEDQPADESNAWTNKHGFVRYKYHEGFTNAVRRPVTMRDMIL